jgi:hypothetical protein
MLSAVHAEAKVKVKPDRDKMRSPFGQPRWPSAAWAVQELRWYASAGVLAMALAAFAAVLPSLV